MKIKCYFRDLQTDRVFSKLFSSPYFEQQFLTKCRYSKKIRYIGREEVWV